MYIAYHKPVGIVCTTDRKRTTPMPSAMKASFPWAGSTSPVKASSSDVRWGHREQGPAARNHHEKEYHVTVDKPIGQLHHRHGWGCLLGTVTRRCEVEQTGPKQFRIVLTQGLNRQIRRMCEHLGYNVVRLKRVRIMHMHLDLPRGEWRDFTAGELRELQRLVNESSKTHDGQG